VLPGGGGGARESPGGGEGGVASTRWRRGRRCRVRDEGC
jgi:hypothetical protein